MAISIALTGLTRGGGASRRTLPRPARLLPAIILLGVAPAAAEEIAYVKFLCTSEGAVADIVQRSDDLIHGLSQLPGGCEWMPHLTTGLVKETVLLIDVAGGRAARISRVIVGSRIGFSAGLVLLTG